VRIGKVSIYLHHSSWWIRFRENRKLKRQRIGDDLEQAKGIAAQVNAQVTTQLPSMFAFQPVTVDRLITDWLDHLEHVVRASSATINRYRTAGRHLQQFAASHQPQCSAHEIDVHGFVRHLRTELVSPNGHPNAAKRALRDNGVIFILTVCKAMFNFAGRRRLVPPYFENPFVGLPIQRMPVEDAKPIFVFDERTELAFLAACDQWAFAVFYLLARTGMRPGELVHLLVEDIDLSQGLMNIRNKPDLGWQVKTRNVRTIPLPDQPLQVLHKIIGQRTAGVLIQRRNLRTSPITCLDRRQLAVELERRVAALGTELDRPLTRLDKARLARRLWRDAGALDNNAIREEFIRVTTRIGLPHVTTPKSWRHTFATLMQEASVDPLIRQQTLGHVSSDRSRSALGMTGAYTHTPREVHRQQLQKTVELRPRTSELVRLFVND
jgi:integrase